MKLNIYSLLKSDTAKCLAQTPLRDVPGIPAVYSSLKTMTQPPLPDEPVWVEYEGYDLFLDPQRKPADLFYRDGVAAHERKVHLAMEQLLSPGGVAVDVGACVGTYTLTMRKLVGGNGTVISFEPNPQNAQYIRKTIAMNGFSNVHVIEAAAANTSGTATFYDYQHAGKSGLRKRDESDPVREFPANVAPIPQKLTDYNVSNIDLLKMDIEGAELEAVKGLGDFLNNIDTIILELHSKPNHHLTPEEGNKLLAVLGEYGTVSLLSDDGTPGKKIQSASGLENRTHLLWSN